MNTGSPKFVLCESDRVSTVTSIRDGMERVEWNEMECNEMEWDGMESETYRYAARHHIINTPQPCGELLHISTAHALDLVKVYLANIVRKWAGQVQ